MRIRGQYRLASFVFLVAACLPFASAQSLATQSAMHTRVQSLYNFSPSKVTDAIRTSKSKEMDDFWKEVTEHKGSDLPFLRRELENPANPPFFFDDGSNLLLSLSQQREDQELAAASIAKADLQDVQSRHYLYEVHALALKGINVTAAALHMLDDPKFEVYLPEHGAYKLDQSLCLLEALLPMKGDLWLAAVMKREPNEADVTARKSMLTLLFYAQTEEADRLLQATVANSTSPKEIQEFAKTIVKHERDLGVGKQPSASNEAKFREERRARMAAISDEAIDDMDELTAKIARARASRVGGG